MLSRIRTLSTGLLLAGFVGSAMAAAPDTLPYGWSRAEAEIELPDVPPPPTPVPVVTPRPVPVDGDRLVQPRLAAPCPDGQPWRGTAAGNARTSA